MPDAEDAQARALAQRLRGHAAVVAHLHVVCLCADWCSTCREYRPVFDAIASTHPTVHFDWVDIEDEAALVGDLEVETFPTVLISDPAAVAFFGPVLPQADPLLRLLRSLPAQR